MPALVLAIYFALIAALAKVSVINLDSAEYNRLVWQKAAQAVVLEGVDQYYKETGVYPDSLSTLANTAGYEHLRSYLSADATNGIFTGSRDLVDVARSNTLTDSFWRYQRAAVFYRDNRTMSAATYLSAAKNGCPPSGTTVDFYSGAAWCGPLKGTWTRLESREQYSNLLADAREQMNETLAKFGEYYNQAGTFPAAATPVLLRSLVSLVGTGSAVGTSVGTCQGQFHLQGIPLDCSDLYNRFGNPLYYQKLTTKRVVLFANSTLVNASGTTVSVAAELNLP